MDISYNIKHYIGFNFVVIPDIKNTKNLTQAQQKSKEEKKVELEAEMEKQIADLEALIP